ncbi:MAG: hypothetical protein V1735_05210 [Nanoarchaeota archaeon]
MIHPSVLLRHYKQREVQEAIVEEAADKEVAVRYAEGFGKRPDVLRNPSDVLELVKKGATSFHISEERWQNALQLSPGMQRGDIESLRTGWDLVLDIDCKFLDYSKIAADLVIKALQHHGINAITCKFSGNKGFHIGIPFEAFPTKIGSVETKLLFPDAPRRIAFYLKAMIQLPLGERILELEQGDFSRVLEKTGIAARDVQATTRDKSGNIVHFLNVEPFLAIDTVLISSRHLYRSSYSFNEKSGLVSVPVKPAEILAFMPEMAQAPHLVEGAFLRRKAEPGEARRLTIQAFDFMPELPEEHGESKEYDLPEEAIVETAFPPCMRLGLKGLPDGKKRFLFALTNFLSCCGWGHEAIEKRLLEWNQANPQQLRQVIITGHMRYSKGKKPILPPNCRSFYEDLRICTPDNLCQRIRNPVSYARRKSQKPEEPVKRKKASRE